VLHPRSRDRLHRQDVDGLVFDAVADVELLDDQVELHREGLLGIEAGLAGGTEADAARPR
jgi:hypothetical protein